MCKNSQVQETEFALSDIYATSKTIQNYVQFAPLKRTRLIKPTSKKDQLILDIDVTPTKALGKPNAHNRPTLNIVVPK